MLVQILFPKRLGTDGFVQTIMIWNVYCYPLGQVDE